MDVIKDFSELIVGDEVGVYDTSKKVTLPVTVSSRTFDRLLTSNGMKFIDGLGLSTDSTPEATYYLVKIPEAVLTTPEDKARRIVRRIDSDIKASEKVKEQRELDCAYAGEHGCYTGDISHYNRGMLKVREYIVKAFKL